MVDENHVQFGISNQEIDNELSKTFKENPTIKNYVELRRNNTDKKIEVAISGGLDWLLTNENKLKKYGIEPALFAKTLDADPKAISELCLQLLELLIERENAESSGETHLVGRGKAISNSLVNHFINTMLDALSWNDDLCLPRDLIVLIRHQLGGDANNAIAKRQKSNELRSHAYTIGAQLLERDKTLSIRKVASILKVNVSTISRMYPENSLQEEAKAFLETLKSVTKSETPFADIIKRHPKNSRPE